MTNITIFTTCAPFKGLYDLIQRNAIKSWLNLEPTPEILIMGGKEEGVKEIAEEYGIRVIPTTYHNLVTSADKSSVKEYIPTTNSIFQGAQKNAKNDILCFTNCDIIHFQCLIDGINTLQQQEFSKNKDGYVVTGRRYDVDINYEITSEMLKDVNYLKSKGRIHGPGANDYFIFPKTFDWSHMPPFDVVRPAWDTWICINTLKRGIPLVDGTDLITIIHQNHERPWNKPSEITELKNNYNITLAGIDYQRGMYKGITESATAVLKHYRASDELIKKRFKMNRDEAAFEDLFYMLKEQKNLVVIDGGACVGDTIDLFKQGWPYSTIYAFEPIDQTINGRTLKNMPQGHLAKNFSNIHIYPYVLGEENKRVNMYITDPVENSSLLKPNMKDNILRQIVQVNMITLDNWAEQNNIQNIDVIKLDLQGYELQALKGMQNILSTTAKAVLLEINFRQRYKNMPTFYDIGFFLQNFAFSFFQLYEISYKQANALFIRGI